MAKIRVIVVDDSYFMRKLISNILNESGIIEVIDTANNGLDAITKILALSPDVITLDVEMPKKNGLEVLKEIMQKRPTPTIMLSSLTKMGADITIQALSFGAFDFIEKPSSNILVDIQKIKDELINKIIMAYEQKERWQRQWVKTQYINQNIKDKAESLVTINESDYLEGVVAIGTSTGGPKALQEVLADLPKEFPYAILIVQHMPPGFTKSLAKRLNSISKINVVEAEDGQKILQGTAYVAPGDFHMKLVKGNNGFQIKLEQSELVGNLRPSVDVLFQSLKDIDLNKIFVIMTGMGSDGTNGAINAKDPQRDILIAEDEKTCVVFGMSKSIIQKGLADEVVLLNEISNSIINSIKKQRRCQ